MRSSTSFWFHATSQFTKISDFRSNNGLQAQMLVLLYSCQLSAFSFPNQHYYEQSFEYIDIVNICKLIVQFFKTTAQTAKTLVLPVSVLILIVLIFTYTSLFYLTIHSIIMQDKVSVSEVKQKRLRKYVCLIIDILFWIPSIIVFQCILHQYYINLSLSGTN